MYHANQALAKGDLILLPNNKILDMTKLKALADDKLSVAKMTIIFLID